MRGVTVGVVGGDRYQDYDGNRTHGTWSQPTCRDKGEASNTSSVHGGGLSPWSCHGLRQEIRRKIKAGTYKSFLNSRERPWACDFRFRLHTMDYNKARVE